MITVLLTPTLSCMTPRQFERPLEWGLADWSFSNHNEDCAAELAVVKALLQRDGAKPMRVMCVASAGETAATLAATEGVQEVGTVQVQHPSGAILFVVGELSSDQSQHASHVRR